MASDVKFECHILMTDDAISTNRKVLKLLPPHIALAKMYSKNLYYV